MTEKVNTVNAEGSDDADENSSGDDISSLENLNPETQFKTHKAKPRKNNTPVLKKDAKNQKGDFKLGKRGTKNKKARSPEDSDSESEQMENNKKKCNRTKQDGKIIIKFNKSLD